ncbi:helix-turn-helix domain-containing protein [uncultured Desulfovibrio sp.]|uniref:helix-turn-helix domain-containing protein n=1 Tax=uncultured Desulfovibrio sp. TaxID=167968 RepID=UPI00351AA5F1
MSIDATRWAWQQRHITTTQKIVLLSMADRAGEDHTCWPSLARLCADTGLSDRAVQKAMRDLEGLGLVRRLSACGKVNTYKLLGVQGRESGAPPKEMRPRTTFTPEQDAPPERGSGHPRIWFPPPPNHVHSSPECGSGRISKRTCQESPRERERVRADAHTLRQGGGT